MTLTIDGKKIEQRPAFTFDAAAFIAALDSFDAEDYPGEQAENLALLRQRDAEAVAIGERAAPNFGPSSNFGPS